MTDWSQIVHEHGPMVWRTIDRLLRHEADTADCFQRTFVTALEVAERETVQHWPALLKRLATCRSLECLRGRIRETGRLAPCSETSTLDQHIDSRSVEPDQAAQSSELADHLRVALAKIDPQQAQVFYLACIEQCNYQEIAEQLKIQANYVGVLLNRAKAALRKQLKGFEPTTATNTKALG